MTANATTSPLAALPRPFPPDWAVGWGVDDHGLYAEFDLAGVVQRMRWIGPGTFMMGSPEDEAERDRDELLHDVTLTQGFWLGETACRQSLWEAVTGENPSRFKGKDRPVEHVNVEDCQGFLERANAILPGGGLRFPTEAEWEYACRAGTTTPFHFGETISTDQANYDGNYVYGAGSKGVWREETTPAGSFPANAFGLFDMHGNVYEWCEDLFGDYPAGPVEDPHGAEQGSDRVLRGGSWDGGPRDCRSAYRFADRPGFRYDYVGFRLARGQ